MTVVHLQGDLDQSLSAALGAILTAFADAAGKTGVGRRIIKPRHNDIAADPWGEALRMLEGGLESRATLDRER